MKSKLANAAQRELVEDTQRLSPEARLEAYLAHSKLVMELYEAGKKLRSTPTGHEDEKYRTR